MVAHRGRLPFSLAILASVALLMLASAAPAVSVTPTRPRTVSAVLEGTAPTPSTVPLATQPKIIIPFLFPDWINVTNPAPGASPPGAWGGSMAYDPADNVTLYFGGCGLSACPGNQTWAFANGGWANLTDPRHAPPARTEASMDYDPNMGGVLLFGGAGTSGLLADTWLFRHGVWTNLTWVGPAPPARYGAAMAFDPQPEENGSVVFGGDVIGIGLANDTWVWQGWSGWVPLATSIAPPVAAFAGMAFDAADGAILLYRPDAANQTWELYSGQWWFVNPTGGVPFQYYYTSTVYDPSLGSVVLFGGIAYYGLANDTYTFAGNNWGLEFPTHTPPPLAAAPIALDPSGSVPVLFGGLNLTQEFASTWVFEVPPFVTLAATASAPEVSAPVTFTATAGDGTPPYTATFNFGDNASATVTSMTSPLTATHAYGRAGSFAPSVVVRDSVGATATSAAPALSIASGPSVTASAHPSIADVGFAFALSAATMPTGIPPLTYAWDFGDGTSGTGANVSHVYNFPGTYAAQVTVTDSAGGTSSATVLVRVNALPSASIVPSNTSGSSGVPMGFFAHLAGGTAPFRYSWSFGDGGTSTSATPTHIFNGTGSYTVQVWVNDSYGGSSHATLTLSVLAVTTAGGGEVPLWFWAGLAALIALGAVGVVLLVILPRRGRPPKPSPPP